MASYSRRLAQLQAKLAPEEEGEAVTYLRLAWPEEDAPAPVTLTRLPGGQVLRTIGYSSIRRGAEISVRWEGDNGSEESVF